jgi:hypothetical protein
VYHCSLYCHGLMCIAVYLKFISIFLCIVWYYTIALFDGIHVSATVLGNRNEIFSVCMHSVRNPLSVWPLVYILIFLCGVA